MATVSIRIPLNTCLICDARRAQTGDIVDLFIDEVKFPAPPYQPIRAAVTSVEEPTVDDPVNSAVIIVVDVDDAYFPVGVGTLEPCDIDRVRCVDCCVQNQEAIEDFGVTFAQVVDDPDPGFLVFPTDSPSDMVAGLEDKPTLMSNEDFGTLIYNDVLDAWVRVQGIDDYNAASGEPTGYYDGQMFRSTGSGTWGGIDWYAGDVGMARLAGVWVKVAGYGEFNAVGVKTFGTQTISGEKTFTSQITFQLEPTFLTGATINGTLTVADIDPVSTSISVAGSIMTNGGQIQCVDFNATNSATIANLVHTGGAAGFYGVPPTLQAAPLNDIVPTITAGVSDPNAKTALDKIILDHNVMLANWREYGLLDT